MDKRIPELALGHARILLRHRAHALLLHVFVAYALRGFTIERLAERIGYAPERLARILGESTNLTLDEISDVMLGMGYEPDFYARELAAVVEPLVAGLGAGEQK